MISFSCFDQTDAEIADANFGCLLLNILHKAVMNIQLLFQVFKAKIYSLNTYSSIFNAL